MGVCDFTYSHQKRSLILTLERRKHVGIEPDLKIGKIYDYKPASPLVLTPNSLKKFYKKNQKQEKINEKPVCGYGCIERLLDSICLISPGIVVYFG